MITVDMGDGNPIPLEELPGMHEHPECLNDDGQPLRHLHGMSKQPAHTHLPVKAWGPAVKP